MTTGRGDSATDLVGLGALGAGIGHMPASWDLEADVVIIGAGATGLPAAIKAADEGASVIVVDANYDVGGHASLSGVNVPLGGGTSAQRQYGIEDSPDTVFTDLTDWSIVQPDGWPDYRYNDRALMRAFADHCAATYEFLVANGVKFKEIPPDNVGAHSTGNSASRENHAFWTEGAGLASPAGRGGAGLVRPLEASARQGRQIPPELQDDEPPAGHLRRWRPWQGGRHHRTVYAEVPARRDDAVAELPLRR
jgi:monoamine oxidase